MALETKGDSVPTEVLWVDDDALELLAPLRRFIERTGAVLTVARTFEEGKKQLPQLGRGSGGNRRALLVDTILPYGREEGTLTTYRGLILAGEAARLRFDVVIAMSVIPESEVHVQWQALIEGFPQTDFVYVHKVELLEPGRINMILNHLVRPASRKAQ